MTKASSADATAWQHLQAFDDLGGQRREIGEGALFSRVAVAIGLAQQDRGRRVAVGDVTVPQSLTVDHTVALDAQPR
jgi:hypothetical protein